MYFRWISATWLCCGLLALACAAWAQETVDQHKVEEFLKKQRQAYEKVEDYTTVFYQQIAEGGELPPKKTIALKFKKPFSVYMKWIGEPNKGREVIFVRDKNDGRLWVHNGGFPDVTLCLDPLVCKALTGARHTVHEVGLGFLINLIEDNFKRALERPQDEVRFLDYGNHDIFGSPAHCMEIVMPKREHSGYYGSRARLCTDTQTNLPVKVTIWDHEDKIWEEFAYSQTKVNVGLTDRDFDPNNPDYNF